MVNAKKLYKRPLILPVRFQTEFFFFFEKILLILIQLTNFVGATEPDLKCET